MAIEIAICLKFMLKYVANRKSNIHAKKVCIAYTNSELVTCNFWLFGKTLNNWGYV